MGPRAIPEDMKRKNSYTCQEWNRCQPQPIYDTDCAFPVCWSHIIGESCTKENIYTKDSE